MYLSEQNDIDRNLKLFLIILVIIVSLGIIMVYSASYIYAKEMYDSSSYFIKKQLYFFIGGVFLAYIVGRTRILFWYKFAIVFNIFCTLPLILTFIPPLGITVKGASRWVSFGIINFQPSEIIKYSILLSSAIFFESFNQLNRRQIATQSFFLLLPLCILLIQPDFGSFTISFMIILFTCYMSSFPRKYFYSIFSGGLLIVLIMLFVRPYRVKRILAFLDPWKNAKTSGFQIIQSYLAFANGSFFGQGLGNSNEKLFYLPEAHNDFIFSVLGEELGFMGVAFSILLFMAFLFFGFKLAISYKHKFSVILISSIIFLISIQAVMNMGVVLGLLPTKGLNLPFISYGGSSLVANFFGIGLIISASRYCKKCQEDNNYVS